MTMRKILIFSQNFRIENTSDKAESVVGAYRAESTDQWTVASAIITNIPPLLNGLTSWFKFEVQIDDWLDFTVLEVSKRVEQTSRRCGSVQGTF